MDGTNVKTDIIYKLTLGICFLKRALWTVESFLKNESMWVA